MVKRLFTTLIVALVSTLFFGSCTKESGTITYKMGFELQSDVIYSITDFMEMDEIESAYMDGLGVGATTFSATGSSDYYDPLVVEMCKEVEASFGGTIYLFTDAVFYVKNVNEDTIIYTWVNE